MCYWIPIQKLVPIVEIPFGVAVKAFVKPPLGVQLSELCSLLYMYILKKKGTEAEAAVRIHLFASTQQAVLLGAENEMVSCLPKLCE